MGRGGLEVECIITVFSACYLDFVVGAEERLRVWFWLGFLVRLGLWVSLG